MKKYNAWVYPVTWMVLIFTGSCIIFDSGTSSLIISDKLIHFIEFGILSSLYFYAFTKTTLIKNSILLIGICTILTIMYGISDEVHQLFVPTREFSVYDILADGVGGVTFATVSAFRKQLLIHGPN